jgi:hypothetical protein
MGMRPVEGNEGKEHHRGQREGGNNNGVGQLMQEFEEMMEMMEAMNKNKDGDGDGQKDQVQDIFKDVAGLFGGMKFG